MGDPYASRWITRPAPRPDARLRLFCLPFGGGAASAFRSWPRRLPEALEPLPIQPPGRESRADEPCIEDLLGMAEALADALRPLVERPYALFGHSIGGVIAFELARALRRRGTPPPVRLIVSASLPGHNQPLPMLQASHLSDAELLKLMANDYQTPLELLGEPEARERALAVLRADVRLTESYREYRPEPPLDVPISAYAGTEDRVATPERIAAWADLTTAAFNTRTFEGGHLFLFPRRDELCRAVVEDLAKDLGGGLGR